MPWKVVQRGEEYCVMKENPDGSMTSVHCHPTRDKAIAQQRALYANTEKELLAIMTEARRGRGLLTRTSTDET